MHQRRWVILALALGGIQERLAAQATPRWEWTVAPAVLAPSFSGSYSVAGFGYSGQVSSSGAGASLYLQALRGDWAFILDGMYLPLNEAALGQCCNPGGSVQVDSGGTDGTQWSAQLLVLRRVATTLELAFGVAANRVAANANVWGVTGGFAGGPTAPFTISSSHTERWAVPVAGARWTPVDHGRWRATLFGEIGFLSGDNKMWQLLPSVGYRVGSVTEIVGQYRMMSTVYRAGPSYEFNYDVSLTGPELAVALRF